MTIDLGGESGRHDPAKTLALRLVCCFYPLSYPETEFLR